MTTDTDKLSPEELADKLEKCRRTATSDRDEVFELLKFYDVLSDEAAPMLRSQETRIKELEAALSSAQADREALIGAVRAATDYDPGLWAYTPFADALPAHLRSEAEGNAKP